MRASNFSTISPGRNIAGGAGVIDRHPLRWVTGCRRVCERAGGGRGAVRERGVRGQHRGAVDVQISGVDRGPARTGKAEIVGVVCAGLGMASRVNTQTLNQVVGSAITCPERKTTTEIAVFGYLHAGYLPNANPGCGSAIPILREYETCTIATGYITARKAQMHRTGRRTGACRGAVGLYAHHVNSTG